MEQQSSLVVGVVVHLDICVQSSLLTFRFKEESDRMKYMYIVMKLMERNEQFASSIYFALPETLRLDRKMVRKILDMKMECFIEKPQVPSFQLDRETILEKCKYMCSIGWIKDQCSLELTRECIKRVETIEMIPSCNPKYLKDREFVMFLLENGQVSRNSSDNMLYTAFYTLTHHYDWLNDRDMIKLIASRYGYLPEQFNRDEELVLLCLRTHCLKCHPDLTREVKFVKQALQVNGLFFQYLDEQMKQDTDLALIAIASNVECIAHFPHNLRGNRNLMTIASQHEKFLSIKRNLSQYIDRGLFKYKEIVFPVLEDNVSMIKYVHASLLSDKEILRIVARKDASLFPNIYNYRTDKEFMSEMIGLGVSLEFVDASIQDLDMVWKAIENMKSVTSFRFINSNLKRNRELTIMALQHDPKVFQFIHSDFKSDPEIALLAVSSYGSNINSLDRNLKKDLIIAKAAVQSCPMALRFIDPKIELYEMLVRMAVARDSDSFKYVTNKESFLPDIISVNPLVLSHVKNKLDYLEYALDVDPSIIKLYESLVSNVEILYLFAKYPQTLKHISYIPTEYHRNELFSRAISLRGLQIRYEHISKILDQPLMLKIYGMYFL